MDGKGTERRRISRLRWRALETRRRRPVICVFRPAKNARTSPRLVTRHGFASIRRRGHCWMPGRPGRRRHAALPRCDRRPQSFGPSRLACIWRSKRRHAQSQLRTSRQDRGDADAWAEGRRLSAIDYGNLRARRDRSLSAPGACRARRCAGRTSLQDRQNPQILAGEDARRAQGSGHRAMADHHLPVGTFDRRCCRRTSSS